MNMNDRPTIPISVVSERTFSRSPGESVLLPCPCPPDQHRINPDRVTWTKDQTAVSNDTESYRGRVWMFNQNHSRNFSLLISDLTKEDSGLYTCRLWNVMLVQM
uniref:Ig-like domain-containing protein n=1 Tax=Pygocentrus nattereri TaxID=42514 RepID=A0A3B4D4B9_PYGNA